MLKTIEKEWQAKITVIFFVVLTVWWIILNFGGFIHIKLQSDLFTVTYGLIALWGGLWGLHIAQKWGGLKSVMGKSIIMFSMGLLMQEFGQLAYTFYIYVLHIEVPYPSFGDVGYFGSIFFYLWGVFFLAKIAGVSISLKSFENKIQAIILPIILVGYSYFLFLKEYVFDLSKPITILLDFGYPLGQSFYISCALLVFLLTRKILGGIMRTKIVFILFALLLQYLADFNFLFQNSRGTWTWSGYGDYLYLIAYFIMAIGLFRLSTAITQIKEL